MRNGAGEVLSLNPGARLRQVMLPLQPPARMLRGNHWRALRDGTPESSPAQRALLTHGDPGILSQSHHSSNCAGQKHWCGDSDNSSGEDARSRIIILPQIISSKKHDKFYEVCKFKIVQLYRHLR